MSNKLRWKKRPQATGLMAVGAGPRGSDYHNGTEKFATVYASGGGGSWRGPLEGWYFVGHIGGEFENTRDRLAPDEATAKKQAEAWVHARLPQSQAPSKKSRSSD